MTAIAGCFSDRGLVIEVDVGDSDAVTVELFLGTDVCTPGDNPAGIDCKTIAPPPPAGPAPMPGKIWFRDNPALEVATVQDHRAIFQLRSDVATTIPMVIAVGMNSRGQGPSQGLDPRAIATATLRDVEIPTTAARVLRTTLVPAASVMSPTGPTVAENRVMVWRKTTMTPTMVQASSCVVTEHWEAGTATRDFIVPGNDPDCDDVMMECDPAAFHGAANAGEAARADCLVNEGEGCALGSHGCTDDDVVRDGQCARQHTRTCVPHAFCDCPTLDPGCFANQLQAQETPRIDCYFPIDTTLALCQNNASALIMLDPAWGGTSSCEQPLIGGLTLDRVATSASFDGATLALSSPRDPCSFSITWTSGSRTASDPVSVGAITVPFPGGAVVLPLVVHFDRVPGGDCAGALGSSCQVMTAPDDSVWDCAR